MYKSLSILLLLFSFQKELKAQKIPNVKLVTLNGINFQTERFNETESKPVVLSFWATWCIPCINELSAINDNIDTWKSNVKFDLYAISEDDSRTAGRVNPLVNGKGWDINVLLDKNQDLKRELNIANVPYTIIIKNGKIIYRHQGYVAGDENEIYKIMKENQ
jgi:thioredoxin-like negative regulator of GroEL